MAGESWVEPHMKESLKNHVLTEIENTPRFRHFRMGRPGTGMFVVYLTFMDLRQPPSNESDRGKMIVIAGGISLCGHTNAVGSKYGYGLAWFTQALSEDYLCEKFLKVGWHREVATKDLRQIAEQLLNDEEHQGDTRENREKRAEELRELAQRVEDGEADNATIYDEFTDIMNGTSPSDYEVGYDYPPIEGGWLCAIQRRFAELFAESKLAV